jgi:lambda family phage tail tape measure protein
MSNIEIRISTDAKSTFDTFRDLTKTLRDSLVAYREAQAKVSALAKEMSSAENPSKQLQKEFAAAKKEVKALADQVDRNRAAMQDGKKALAAHGFDTSRLSQEYARLKKESAAAAAAQDALGRSQAAWNRLSQQGAQVAEQLARRNAEAAKLRALSTASATPFTAPAGGQVGALRDIKSGMDSISAQLSIVRSQILQAFSVSIIADKGHEVIAMADSMTLLDARIKLATTSLGEFRTARDGIVDIAQPIGAELEQVGGGFTRIANAIKQYRGTAAQALQLTEMITVTAKLSGAATAEAAASTMQFAQAMGSGVLQGDELRSILENNMRLAQALADGLGIAVGDLKKWGEQGKLTTDVVARALASQLGRIREEVGTVPVTVEASGQRLKNAFALWVAESEHVGAVQQNLAAGLDTLSKHIDAIVAAVTLGANVLAALLAGRMANALVGWIGKLGEATLKLGGLRGALSFFGAPGLIVGGLTMIGASFLELGNRAEETGRKAESALERLRRQNEETRKALEQKQADSPEGRAQSAKEELAGLIAKRAAMQEELQRARAAQAAKPMQDLTLILRLQSAIEDLNKAIDAGAKALADQANLLKKTWEGFGGNKKPIDESKPKEQRYDPLFDAATQKYGLPVGLVKAIAWKESGFNPTATNPSGATGIMQMIPSTAARYGVKDAKDPAQAIEGAARYLADLLREMGGDLEQTIAAYNSYSAYKMAKAGRYDRALLPAETKDYVPKVLDKMEEFGGPRSNVEARKRQLAEEEQLFTAERNREVALAEAAAKKIQAARQTALTDLEAEMAERRNRRAEAMLGSTGDARMRLEARQAIQAQADAVEYARRKQAIDLRILDAERDVAAERLKAYRAEQAQAAHFEKSAAERLDLNTKIRTAEVDLAVIAEKRRQAETKASTDIQAALQAEADAKDAAKRKSIELNETAISRAQSLADARAQGIRAQQEAGIYTQAEARQKLNELYGQSAEAIRQNVEELQRLAAADPSGDMALKAEQARNAWQDMRNSVRTPLQSMLIQWQDTGMQMEQMSTQWASSFSDTLTQLATTGKLQFADFAKAILTDLVRITIQSLIAQAAMSFFGGGFGLGGGGVANAAAGAGAANGLGAISVSGLVPTRHTGGLMSEGGPARRVPLALFTGAPKFHTGGIAGLAAGEVPAILKRREGVFTEGQMRALAPVSDVAAAAGAAARAGGALAVVVNDYSTRGGNEVKARETRDANGNPAVELNIYDKLGSALDSGRLDGAMSRNYGLKRTGTRR